MGVEEADRQSQPQDGSSPTASNLSCSVLHKLGTVVSPRPCELRKSSFIQPTVIVWITYWVLGSRLGTEVTQEFSLDFQAPKPYGKFRRYPQDTWSHQAMI